MIFALGNVVSKIAQFFLLALFTSYMTIGGYGDAELIITFISLIIPIFTLSISDATLRFLFDKGTEKNVISSGFLVVLTGILVIIIITPILSMFDTIKPYAFFIIVLYVAASLEQFFFSVNKGLEKVRICALNPLVSVVFLFLFSYFFIVKGGYGIYGYLISIILAHVVCSVYLFIGGHINRYINFYFVDKQMLSKMLLYSVPFVPSTIAWWINSASDKYLIVLFLGSSYNGLYSAAAKIPNIIAVITTVFFQAWQLSGIKESKDEHYSQFYSNIYNLFLFFFFFSGAVLILMLPYLSPLIFKDDFEEAWYYSPFLILASVFSGLSGILAPAYMAFKNTKSLMYSTLLGAVINICLNIIMLPIVGLQAASISTFLSFLIVWLIRLFFAKKIISISISWFNVFLCMVLLLIQIIATLFFTRISFIVGLFIVAVILYLIIINNKSIIKFVCHKINAYK